MNTYYRMTDATMLHVVGQKRSVTEMVAAVADYGSDDLNRRIRDLARQSGEYSSDQDYDAGNVAAAYARIVTEFKR